jgi:hypothetical protein
MAQPQEETQDARKPLSQQRQPRRAPAHVAKPAVRRPQLSEAGKFLQLEREVEEEYRPQLLAALQHKVDAVAEATRELEPQCPQCSQRMKYHDARSVSWLARFGRLKAKVRRYRCRRCAKQCRPLLDELGVEPGRISGSLARLLGLLAVVAPYPLAAQLAWLLLGVKVSPMGVWRAAQRLGEAAAQYSEGLGRYHGDSHSNGAAVKDAPPVVVLGVDACSLGMQVRATRRRPTADGEPLPPLPAVEEGGFRDVKTAVVLMPNERVETSPGRRSLVRRFLVSCLGHADEIYSQIWAQLQELGWLGAQTTVVIVGDGAEWIWKRATMFRRRCEILDFWHALEHAWSFAHLYYGAGAAQADRWVRQIAEDLRAGKVKEVIARLKRLRPKTPEARDSLVALIRYYTDNSARMQYDEYLRLGYGIGSGAVESAHKQVIHARFRQAGMRWSVAGARRLLALRLLLLNDNWALLDQLRMISPAA